MLASRKQRSSKNGCDEIKCEKKNKTRLIVDRDKPGISEFILMFKKGQYNVLNSKLQKVYKSLDL